MARAVGVAMTDRLAVGVVEDNRLSGGVRRFPESENGFETLRGMPADDIAANIRRQIEAALGDRPADVIGLGLPGIIRGGIIEDSPNLHQMKGMNIQLVLAESLRHAGREVPVVVSNDADVMAAGIAATRGQLDRLIRVWTLGNGIGYGRYPQSEGVW